MSNHAHRRRVGRAKQTRPLPDVDLPPNAHLYRLPMGVHHHRLNLGAMALQAEARAVKRGCTCAEPMFSHVIHTTGYPPTAEVIVCTVDHTDPSCPLAPVDAEGVDL